MRRECISVGGAAVQLFIRRKFHFPSSTTFVLVPMVVHSGEEVAEEVMLRVFTSAPPPDLSRLLPSHFLVWCMVDARWLALGLHYHCLEFWSVSKVYSASEVYIMGEISCTTYKSRCRSSLSRGTLHRRRIISDTYFIWRVSGNMQGAVEF